MRRTGHHLAWGKWRLFGAELLLAATLAAVLLHLVRGGNGPPAGTTGVATGGMTVLLVLLPAVWLALYAADLFEVQVARRDRERGTRLLLSLGMSLVVLAVAEPWLRAHLNLAQGALLSTAGVLLGAQALTRGQLHRLGRLSGGSVRVALAGERAAMGALADCIAEDADAVVEVVDQLELHSRDVADRVARSGADLLVVCAVQRRGQLDMRSLLEITLAGTRVMESSDFAEQYLRRVPLIGLRPFHLVYGGVSHPGPLESGLLWLLNVGGALVLLALAWPLLLLAAIAVRLDSPGPVLYRQERVGLGGRTFTLFKFRTMRADAEAAGPKWATVGDCRVTRVGRWLRRWRMDELPQLFNVLAGDMALVGPRPERPEFVRRLKQEIPFYGLRECVPPGLSGWAQVRCAYASTVEEQSIKLEHDLYYVRHRSLLLDLAVLARTLKVVVLGRGAR
jgi:exopolysaccharide biosynthesis polyprenyl glycosylphosphotransferase